MDQAGEKESEPKRKGRTKHAANRQWRGNKQNILQSTILVKNINNYGTVVQLRRRLC